MARGDWTLGDMANMLLPLEDKSLLSPVASPSVLPVESGSAEGLLGVVTDEDLGIAKDEIPVKPPGPMTRLPDTIGVTGEMQTDGLSIPSDILDLTDYAAEFDFGEPLEREGGMFEDVGISGAFSEEPKTIESPSESPRQEITSPAISREEGNPRPAEIGTAADMPAEIQADVMERENPDRTVEFQREVLENVVERTPPAPSSVAQNERSAPSPRSESKPESIGQERSDISGEAMAAARAIRTEREAEEERTSSSREESTPEVETRTETIREIMPEIEARVERGPSASTVTETLREIETRMVEIPPSLPSEREGGETTSETRPEITGEVQPEIGEGMSGEVGEAETQVVREIRTQLEEAVRPVVSKEVRTEVTERVVPETIEETKSEFLAETVARAEGEIRPTSVGTAPSMEGERPPALGSTELGQPELSGESMTNASPSPPEEIVREVGPETAEAIQQGILREIRTESVESIRTEIAGDILAEPTADRGPRTPSDSPPETTRVETKEVSPEVRTQIVREMMPEVAESMRTRIVESVQSEIEGEIQADSPEEIRTEIIREVQPEIAGQVQPSIAEEIWPEIAGEIRPAMAEGLASPADIEPRSSMPQETRVEIVREIQPEIIERSAPRMAETMQPQITSEIERVDEEEEIRERTENTPFEAMIGDAASLDRYPEGQSDEDSSGGSGGFSEIRPGVSYIKGIPTYDAATLSAPSPRETDESEEIKASIESWLGRESTPEELALMMPKGVVEEVIEYYSLAGIDTPPPTPEERDEARIATDGGVESSQSTGDGYNPSLGSSSGMLVEGEMAREIREKITGDTNAINPLLLDRLSKEMDDKLNPVREEILSQAGQNANRIFNDGLHDFTKGA